MPNPTPSPVRVAAVRAARVVRLSPFALEVVRECPRKPWDVAEGVFSKRRDAERAAEQIERMR